MARAPFRPRGDVTQCGNRARPLPDASPVAAPKRRRCTDPASRPMCESRICEKLEVATCRLLRLPGRHIGGGNGGAESRFLVHRPCPGVDPAGAHLGTRRLPAALVAHVPRRHWYDDYVCISPRTEQARLGFIDETRSLNGIIQPLVPSLRRVNDFTGKRTRVPVDGHAASSA